LNTLISKETQLFTAFLAVSNFYRAVDTVNHERHRTWGRQLAGSFPSHALPGHPSIQRIARTREAASVSPPCSHVDPVVRHRRTLARYRCATGQGQGNLASTRTPATLSSFRGAFFRPWCPGRAVSPLRLRPGQDTTRLPS
jgi:hypothetical protein